MQLDFKEAYLLENDVVQLRPLELADVENLLPFSENEPELWIYNANGPAGADNLERYIVRALDERNQQSAYPFVVFDKRSGKYAGCTRFYNIQHENQTLEIGYTWYGKDFQGSGLNKNCKMLMLAFAFERLEMERVGFRANALNSKSIAAMKSIGCIEEGILRSFSTNAQGNRIDSIILSILKAEWLGGVRGKLHAQITR